MGGCAVAAAMVLNRNRNSPLKDSPPRVLGKSAAMNAADRATRESEKLDDSQKTEKYSGTGTNWVAGGADENPFLLFLCVVGPMLCHLLAYLTSDGMMKSLNGATWKPGSGGTEPHITTLVPACFGDLKHCAATL